MNGRFEVQKPQWFISGKPNNKAHEHNIKVIKESNVAIGIVDYVISSAKRGLARLFINLGEKNICKTMMKTTNILKKIVWERL